MIKPLIPDDKFAAWLAGFLIVFLSASTVFFVISPELIAHNIYLYLGLMLAFSFVSVLAAIVVPKEWSTNIGREQIAYIGIGIGLLLGLVIQLGTQNSLIKLSYFGDLSNTFIVNVFAPIVEELMFRGVILNATYFFVVKLLGEKNKLSIPIGILSAVLVSSYAFGAWHIFAYGTGQIGFDFGKLSTIALYGALFAIGDLLLGSLLLSMCFHFVNNLGASSLTYTSIIPDALIFGIVLISLTYVSRRLGGSGLRVVSV